MVKLKSCGRVLARNRREATIVHQQTAKQPFGYSTLLNFAADGTKHVLLTSDAEEFLFRTKCHQGQIFQPFTQQCLRPDCHEDEIPYNGDCIEKDLKIQGKENICMDFYIAYKLSDNLPEPIAQDDFKLTLVQTLIEHFDFNPENIILPNNLFDNTSQCLNPEGFMASYMMWNSTNLDEMMSKTPKYIINTAKPSNEHKRCKDTNTKQEDTKLSKVVFSLKFTGQNSEFVDLNETLKARQFEKVLNISLFDIIYRGNTSESTLAGSGCIYDMDAQSLEESWCQGFEQKYFDDQFYVEFKGTDIISVHIKQTGKTYRKTEFQYTAVLDGPFWGDISQVVSTCDVYPEIKANLSSCVTVPLSFKNYELMNNRSIHVPILDEFNVQMPFENEARPKIQSVFGLNEYQYLNYGDTNLNLEDIIDGSIKPNISICVPSALVELVFELDMWDKLKINQSCSYLQDFGHGSSIAGVVCSGVSMIAMIMILVTYSIFRSLRTLPGVSLMNLTVALILSQLMFHVGLLVPKDWEDTSYVCFSTAVLTHYCTLASFTWMNVMAYSSYRAFGANLKTRLMQLNKRHLLFNALYGWGLPAIFVLVCALVDYAYRDKKHIGYGLVAAVKIVDERDVKTGNIDNIKLYYRRTSSCWIGNSQAAVLIFGIPLCFCMTLNLGLFLKTCWGKYGYLFISS